MNAVPSHLVAALATLRVGASSSIAEKLGGLLVFTFFAVSGLYFLIHPGKFYKAFSLMDPKYREVIANKERPYTDRSIFVLVVWTGIAFAGVLIAVLNLFR